MKKDLRVIKTDRNIKESFIRLIGRKSFESITVQNILDEALINRTTFYNHFSSKYELAETIAAELLAKYEQALDVRFGETGNDPDMYARLEMIGRLLSEDSSKILAMWTVHTESIHLYDDMRIKLEERITLALKNTATEFQVQLAVSILMTMFRHILSDSNTTASKLHDEAVDFFRKNILPGNVSS